MVRHFYRNWIIRIMGFGHEDTRTKPLSTCPPRILLISSPLQPGIYSAFSYSLTFNNINDSKSANRMSDFTILLTKAPSVFGISRAPEGCGNAGWR